MLQQRQTVHSRGGKSSPMSWRSIYLSLSRSVSEDSGSALLIDGTSGMSWERSSSRVHASWTVRQDVQPANSRGRCDMQDEPPSSNNAGVCREMGRQWTVLVLRKVHKHYDPVLISLWSLMEEMTSI